jgi:hypothetical protein
MGSVLRGRARPVAFELLMPPVISWGRITPTYSATTPAVIIHAVAKFLPLAQNDLHRDPHASDIVLSFRGQHLYSE